jgi:hypothetical protein
MLRVSENVGPANWRRTSFAVPSVVEESSRPSHDNIQNRAAVPVSLLPFAAQSDAKREHKPAAQQPLSRLKSTSELSLGVSSGQPALFARLLP